MGESISKLIHKIKEIYCIPKNHTQEIEDHNLNILKWITLVLGVLGFTFLIINVFTFNSRTHEEFIRIIFYYGVYFVFGTGISLTCFLLSRKTVNLLVKRIPTYLILVVIVLLTIFVSRTMKGDESLLILIIMLCIENLIVITFLYVNPVFFNFILILLFSDILMTQTTNFLVRINTSLLVVIISILSLYKTRITVRNLKQKDKLETQSSMLRQQTFELQAQQEELIKLKDKLEQRVDSQEIEIRKKNEKIIQIQKHIIMSLSALVENRDRDTGLHVFRTSLYVKTLAQEAMMQGLYPEIINEEYIDLLEKAAPMHDIGKIVISDMILKKPGRLDENEFKEMQKHTIEGGRIIEDVLGNAESDEYVKIASEITEGHHEKWNGKGYPNGLAGEAIPLSARFMAIADVYDALVSVRCYKEALSDEEAFIIIEEGIGSHFDPQLARLFLEIKDKIIAIKEKYKDN